MRLGATKFCPWFARARAIVIMRQTACCFITKHFTTVFTYAISIRKQI